jgi:hypothetical protein
MELLDRPENRALQESKERLANKGLRVLLERPEK